MMKRIFASCILTLGILFSAGVPVFVQAAEQCTCFCKTTSGASKIGEKIPTECHASCKDGVAACAYNNSEYPSSNLNCYTKDQCDNQDGVLDTKFQPPECPTGRHYCYPNPSKREQVKLSVAIGGLTSTGDLAEYIDAGYRWLLGSSIIIVIVMVMVGGVQYTLGAGSGDVGKGKERIKKAVIGLVLLLSTYVILYTVNPQLVKLQLPKFPMTRPVGLAASGADCQKLLDQNFVVNFEGEKVCGTSGEVVKDANGNDVADGISCNFTACGSNGAYDTSYDRLCVGEQNPTCLTCTQVAPGNAARVQASSAICSAFNALPYAEAKRNADGHLLKQNYCFYTQDPSVGGSLMGEGVCASLALDCAQVNSCQQYDVLKVFSSTGAAVDLDEIDVGKSAGYSFDTTQISESAFNQLGDLTLGGVCQRAPFSDPCEWNRQDFRTERRATGTNIRTGATTYSNVQTGLTTCETQTQSLLPWSWTLGFGNAATVKYDCVGR